jgi:hypothetical protein
VSDDDLQRELRGLKSGPTPREGFTDAVMQQVSLRKKPKPKFSLWRMLRTERTITLRFRWSQLAGACAFLVVGGVFVARELRRPVAPVQHAVVAPTSGEERVRFALQARDAKSVSLTGDFNGWRPDATPMQRAADGTWTITVPLGSGSWAYSFVVDGQIVEDPFAETYRADGFGGRNAIVRVGEQG